MEDFNTWLQRKIQASAKSDSLRGYNDITIAKLDAGYIPPSPRITRASLTMHVGFGGRFEFRGFIENREQTLHLYDYDIFIDLMRAEYDRACKARARHHPNAPMLSTTEASNE